MSTSVEATAQVFQNMDRLATANLVHPLQGDGPKGLTEDGWTTLTDLLSVVIFQCGSDPHASTQVASATARAMLSAVGDVYREAGGDGPDAETLRLLTAAVREARA